MTTTKAATRGNLKWPDRHRCRRQGRLRHGHPEPCIRYLNDDATATRTYGTTNPPPMLCHASFSDNDRVTRPRCPRRRTRMTTTTTLDSQCCCGCLSQVSPRQQWQQRRRGLQWGTSLPPPAPCACPQAGASATTAMRVHQPLPKVMYTPNTCAFIVT